MCARFLGVCERCDRPQNPVLGHCSPCNASTTRFWAIAALAIRLKPGFGPLQTLQFVYNPVLSHCSPCNSSTTRFGRKSMSNNVCLEASFLAPQRGRECGRIRERGKGYDMSQIRTPILLSMVTLPAKTTT